MREQPAEASWSWVYGLNPGLQHTEGTVQQLVDLLEIVNVNRSVLGNFDQTWYSEGFKGNVSCLQPFALLAKWVEINTEKLFFNLKWKILNPESSKIVCDQNQVSVSGTETKVQIGYRYRSWFFFPKPKLQSFSNILMFFCFLWGYNFWVNFHPTLWVSGGSIVLSGS